MENKQLVLYSLIIVAILLLAFSFNKITGQAASFGPKQLASESATLKVSQNPTYNFPVKTIITISPRIVKPGEKTTITVTPKELESIDIEIGLYQLRTTELGTKEVFKSSERIPSIGSKILNKETIISYRIGSNVEQGLYKVGFKIKGTNSIIYSNTFEVKK